MNVNIDTNFIFNRFLQLTGLCKKPEVVISIFELGKVYDINKNQIVRWSKINADRSTPQVMPDQVFSAFIRGLFAYTRIQKSLGVKVFDLEKEFIDDVISMFFDYRNEMSEKGKNIFNFNQLNY